MGALVRAFFVIAAFTGGVFAAVWQTTVVMVTQLATVTALVMGGTGHPLVDYGPVPDSDEEVVAYITAMGANYIAPSVALWGDDLNGYVAVYTPEQFWPLPKHELTFDESVGYGVVNLSRCVENASSCPRNTDLGPAPGDVTGPYVIFGYSQSGRIETIYKRALIDAAGLTGWASVPQVSFVVIGDPSRPNGGLLERFKGLSIPFFGITFDGAMPTDSGCDANGANCHLNTVDTAWQYDAIADFPKYPLNLLADINSLIAYFTEHSGYNVPLTDASVIDQGTYGDTQYYMIGAQQLPILSIFNGWVPHWLLAGLDVPLRTFIELGYDRSESPGQPTTASLLRLSGLSDLITMGIAVFTGIDDGVAALTGNPDFRPFHTTPVTGTFGVPSWSFSGIGSNVTTATQTSAKTVVPVADAVGAAAVESSGYTAGRRDVDGRLGNSALRLSKGLPAHRTVRGADTDTDGPKVDTDGRTTQGAERAHDNSTAKPGMRMGKPQPAKVGSAVAKATGARATVDAA